MTEQTKDLLSNADDAAQSKNWKPMSFEEFVDEMVENPDVVSQAAKYVLSAIEYFGTRDVIESGETLERYKFFDDPANDGEHAILGNTKELNRIVNTIRSIASGTGKHEKLLWIHGPTATGKSEFKRCLINGLREYSKTEEGARYTLEWNRESSPEMEYDPTFGRKVDNTQTYSWNKSPVQTNPFSVLPRETQQELLEQWNADEDRLITPQTQLDPFSRVYYDKLSDEYSEGTQNRLFSRITSDDHLRVRRFIMDKGTGIGVLSPDDGGSPKEKLVGNWIPSQLQKVDSTGGKNPLAFSYSGLFSQGNGGVSIIEDAVQHSQLLQKLLLALDEDEIKLDHGIEMEIDTLLLMISNPDLEALLNQSTQQNEADPLKAFKRRIEKHNFNYLLNISLEAKLLRKELSRHLNRPVETTIDSDLYEPVEIPHYETEDGSKDTELAPYTVYAAALYNVTSRLSDETDELTVIEKAKLYDKGYIYQDGEKKTLEDFSINPDDTEGRIGIPVTHTRDLLADLIISADEHSIESAHISDVVLPQDIIGQLDASFSEAPVFNDKEQSKFEAFADVVLSHVEEHQLQDVLDAALLNTQPSEEEIEEYVDEVFNWDENEEPDNYLLKLFETENIPQFSSEDYSESDATPNKKSIKDFRREKIIRPFSRLWAERDDDYTVEDVDYTQLDVFQELLSENTVDDLQREFPDFSPHDWDNPSENTSTMTVKEQTLETMQTEFNYSEESARATARLMMEKVTEQWE